MRNRHLLTSAAIFLLLYFVAGMTAAESLSVDFLEGHLEFLHGHSWRDCSIGDSLSMGTTLRLSGDGYVEMTDGNGLTVALIEEGTYRVADLISHLEGRTNFRRILGNKIKSLLKGHRSDDVSVGGVRAREVEEAVVDDMMFMDSASNYLEDAAVLLEKGNIPGARALYEEGMLYDSGAVQRECAFRYGVCLQWLGELREARKILTALKPDPDDSFYGEWVVVTALLYIESREMEDAEGILMDYLEHHPTGGPHASDAKKLLESF